MQGNIVDSSTFAVVTSVTTDVVTLSFLNSAVPCDITLEVIVFFFFACPPFSLKNEQIDQLIT